MHPANGQDQPASLEMIDRKEGGLFRQNASLPPARWTPDGWPRLALTGAPATSRSFRAWRACLPGIRPWPAGPHATALPFFAGRLSHVQKSRESSCSTS